MDDINVGTLKVIHRNLLSERNHWRNNGGGAWGSGPYFGWGRSWDLRKIGEKIGEGVGIVIEENTWMCVKLLDELFLLVGDFLAENVEVPPFIAEPGYATEKSYFGQTTSKTDDWLERRKRPGTRRMVHKDEENLGTPRKGWMDDITTAPITQYNQLQRNL